jgi:hypothetical protein
MDTRLQGLEGLLSQQQKRESTTISQQTGDHKSSGWLENSEFNILGQERIHAPTVNESSDLEWYLGLSPNETFGGVDLDCWTEVNQTTSVQEAGPQHIQRESLEDALLFPDMNLEEFGPVKTRDNVVGGDAALLQLKNDDNLQSTLQGQFFHPNSLHQTEKREDSHEQMLQASEDDITHQLANRFGRLQMADDGHLRYFGPTSHLHIMPQELVSFYQPSARILRDKGESAVDRAGLQWTPDAEYENHLTRLYFAWHNPWVNEVDQQIYHCEKEVYETGRETPLYTPALNNAM